MPKQLRPTKVRDVMTPIQRSKLYAHPMKKVRVKEHERTLYRRSPLQRRRRMADNFARSFFGSIERHGITEADRKAIRMIVEMAHDFGMV